jgi:hypothetical protein
VSKPRIEVVLVRNGRGGANHVAQPRPIGGRYVLACWRTCSPGRRGLVQREPAEIRRSLEHEWICSDCSDLLRLARDPEAFLRATGWRLAA